MSVLVVGKFQGDTAKFRQALIERGTEFAQIADRARASGAMHHRFGIGDGFVMIIDEWESPEHFRKFFSDSPTNLSYSRPASYPSQNPRWHALGRASGKLPATLFA